MVNLHNPKGILFIFILLIIFPSCMLTKNHGQQHMSEGEYQQTIDAYKVEQTLQPWNQKLVKDYVKTLEEIKQAADSALDREDYAAAGKTYNILLKNYPDFRGFANRLSFNKAQLNAKIRKCKAALSQKGFEEYRQGNLGEAIALWQGYLAIDPNNTDVRKAVNTAKMQQKNIK